MNDPTHSNDANSPLVDNIVVIQAPITGWLMPLADVPDEAFSLGMAGAGVAIDPTSSSLCSPCDGEVILIAKTCHSITLRTANGAEILMHVGLDTVGLKGAGFRVLVNEGDRISTGSTLIEFDMDILAQRAKSLITPIVVVNDEDFVLELSETNREIKTGTLFSLRRVSGKDIQTSAHSPKGQLIEYEKTAIIALTHGIHARPASRIAACAKTFTEEIWLGCGDATVNAKSMSALMSLGTRFGDEVYVRAQGNESEAAVIAIIKLIISGGEEDAVEQFTAPAAEAITGAYKTNTSSSKPEVKRDGPKVTGVKAARGLAVGPAVWLGSDDQAVDEGGVGVAEETGLLIEALESLQKQLEETEATDTHQHDIIAAHIDLLMDPGLLDSAKKIIDEGKSAGFAWRRTMRQQVTVLEAMDDPRMRERTADFIDIERQVITKLLGQSEQFDIQKLEKDCILFAEELLPSQLLAHKESQIGGICASAGGPTSHVAIMAAAMNIPMIVATGLSAADLPKGQLVILDADHHLINLNPSNEDLDEVNATIEKRRQAKERAAETMYADAHTADGERINVFANLGAASEADDAIGYGAEGCGLLRTEFLFLERGTPPTTSEQSQHYDAIAKSLNGRPFVIRTMDFGADKPVPYLDMLKEENPALGMRGIRTSLWRQDIFRSQLQAVFSLKSKDNARIMIPMVTSVSELILVKAIIEDVKRDVGFSGTMPFGVMIETPASAILADQIAAEVDFMSIGTNDLSQYVLAMDRGHPNLAAEIDALHPAVIRMIAKTGEAGAQSDCLVSVCGGLASDLVAVPILIGLGVTTLSAVPSCIPEIKALISNLSLSECRSVAQEALSLKSASEVRELAIFRWPQLGD